MKNKLLIVIISFLSFSSEVFASDGTINFTGQITDTACSVSVANQIQSVSLGTVSVKAFSAAGDTASATKFTIKLSGCPKSATNASVSFDGAATTDNRILALNTGDGVATNVGIGIYENDSSTLIGLQNHSKMQTLKEGDNELAYIAKYYAVAASVTPGAANATTTYTLIYQ
ncbi:fimbrial protein [Orbus wheelerorum]|uniref:fimbrial protein n=1 Tax=Orbus wheelerorum TaxID=3074111 RepID=UPI00370D89A2